MADAPGREPVRAGATGGPSVPRRRLTEIADGVHVWIGDGRPGGANAGVVVDDDGVTVVDTLMVRSQWEPFAAAVARLGGPVRRCVLTHSHIEQVGGTKAFAHAAVYGTRATSVLLDQPMPVEAYQAFMPAHAAELAELAELGTRPVTHEVLAAAQLTPRVELLPASGHTRGDLLVLVADADVCFAGGLASFGVTPLGFQADFLEWAEMLDAVADLADVVVPAEGPPGGADDLRALQAYLRACVAAHGDPRALGRGPWDGWSERVPRDAMNVERAAIVATGGDELPPTMTRLAGI